MTRPIKKAARPKATRNGPYPGINRRGSHLNMTGSDLHIDMAGDPLPNPARVSHYHLLAIDGPCNNTHIIIAVWNHQQSTSDELHCCDCIAPVAHLGNGLARKDGTKLRDGAEPAVQSLDCCKCIGAVRRGSRLVPVKYRDKRSHGQRLMHLRAWWSKQC